MYQAMLILLDEFNKEQAELKSQEQSHTDKVV